MAKKLTFDCVLDKKEFSKCGCFYKDQATGKCAAPCVVKFVKLIGELKMTIGQLESENDSLRHKIQELKNEV